MSDMKFTRIGYFGKVPTRGDFVSRNIEPLMKNEIDSWLQSSIEKSKDILRDNWLNSFLTSPIWRFVINKSSDIKNAYVGMMIPSVDKVGRYFPFLILLEFEEYKGTAGDIILSDCILQEFEPLLLGSLQDDFDLDYFDYQISNIAKQLSNKDLYNLLIAENRNLSSTTNILKKDFTSDIPQGKSLWWTEGSEYRMSEFLVYEGMPNFNVYASFLRDADSYSDLETLWTKARELGYMQNTNDSFELSNNEIGSNLFMLSHNGNNETLNTIYMSSERGTNCLVISDGRFGDMRSAMISRFLCLLLPTLYVAEKNEIDTSQLERVFTYLKTKMPNAEHNKLTMPMSFILICKSLRDGVECINIFKAGDYHCYFSNFERELCNAFEIQTLEAETTIKQDEIVYYDSKQIAVSNCRQLFFYNDISDAFHSLNKFSLPQKPNKLDVVAKVIIQDILLTGNAGNIGLGIIEFEDNNLKL